MKKRKILVFTGSRGEWGYLRPVIEEIEKVDIEIAIVVSNMHVDERFGETKVEIQKDGFEIYDSIYMNLIAPSKVGWTKSLGILLFQIPDILNRFNPDIVLLAGDRAETFTFAVGSFYSNYCIAHIQAGELSGHKDGMARHALGKFAHIHIASNDDAADRLKRLGEPEFRIYNTGAPQLDDIINSKIKGDDIKSIKKSLRVDNKKNYCLCIMHSSSDEKNIYKVVELINKTLLELNIFQIWILPNNDSGSDLIRNEIINLKRKNIAFVNNMKRANFIELLKNSDFLIGNSSCGILEAPALGIPSINMGVRQKGRMQAKSVVHTKIFNKQSIKDAIRLCYKIEKGKNYSLYGDGKSSKRIAKIFKDIIIDKKLKDKYLNE